MKQKMNVNSMEAILLLFTMRMITISSNHWYPCNKVSFLCKQNFWKLFPSFPKFISFTVACSVCQGGSTGCSKFWVGLTQQSTGTDMFTDDSGYDFVPSDAVATNQSNDECHGLEPHLVQQSCLNHISFFCAVPGWVLSLLPIWWHFGTSCCFYVPQNGHVFFYRNNISMLVWQWRHIQHFPKSFRYKHWSLPHFEQKLSNIFHSCELYCKYFNCFALRLGKCFWF